jgi:c-di-GMP-binding flagellar brake protein YcgR
MPGLWDRVVLILENCGERSEFASRIEDIRHDSYVLEMPLRQSGEFHLHKGDAVEVVFSRRDAVYSFKASILDLFESDERTMRIEKTSEIKRIQRRKYVRLDLSGKMQFRILDIAKSNNPGPDLSGTLLNISAGGVLFESPVKVAEKEFIIVSFTLKGRQTLDGILAVTKRCEGSRAKGYLVGAEFVTRRNSSDHDIEHFDEFLPPGAGTFDENLQKLVVQFIYNQQVELRKKGLLTR